MRFLFVHQNFPGQFLHVLRHLADQRRHELVFITEENGNTLTGVRKVTYRGPERQRDTTFRDAQEFEHAAIRAQHVAQIGQNLKALGFTPDIVIGHHGWGEMLNMEDVWPGVPVLGYYEFYYNIYGKDVGFDPEFQTPAELMPRVRAKNAVNLIALNNPGHGQTPTLFQHTTYPGWAQPAITVLPEGVQLDQCRPDAGARRRVLNLNGFKVGPKDKLITYVARDLEPYRGFHVMMRALPALLARPDVKIVLVGGDGVSYGPQLVDRTWREHFTAELGVTLDPDRVCFPGRIGYEPYIKMLQRSDAHVYLTYPFVASWSLREALACGCALVASDTEPVQEFVQDGVNGLLTPCLDPALLAGQVLRLLEDTALSTRLRRGARVFAERHLRMQDHLAGYEALIGTLTGQTLEERGPYG